MLVFLINIFILALYMTYRFFYPLSVSFGSDIWNAFAISLEKWSTAYCNVVNKNKFKDFVANKPFAIYR